MQQLSRQFSFSFEELIMKEASVVRFISADKSLMELMGTSEHDLSFDKSGLERYFKKLWNVNPICLMMPASVFTTKMES